MALEILAYHTEVAVMPHRTAEVLGSGLVRPDHPAALPRVRGRRGLACAGGGGLRFLLDGPDGGGAIHVAVWVPYEQTEARIAAKLGAGGRMVRDPFAPAWWTLADAAGNEADIATTMSRD